MADAPRDGNRVTTLMGVSSADGITLIPIQVDPATGSILANLPGGAGGANTGLSNLSSVAINTSLISDTDITDDLGTAAIRWKDIYATTLNTGDTAADTLILRARDVDGASWTDFITLTANNTPTCVLSGAVTGITQSVDNNSTKLATTAFVIAQVATANSWAESLAIGNTSGATDVVIDSGQKLTTNTIDETTAASGVTIETILLKDKIIGATADRVTKIWTEDLTVTNTISGSITGNAATVTTNANLTGIVTSAGNATAIADKAIAIAKLADGTDGELITWDSDGVITTVTVGTANQVLTSNGVGEAPTFQAVAGGGDVIKVGTPVDNQVGVWTGDGTIEGTTGLTYDGSNFQLTGDIGATASRITKGWFADLEVTNAIAGSITGNAATVSTIAGLAPDTATTQATQPTIATCDALTSIQQLTVTLADAGANAILGWDDTASAYENLSQAEVLAIIGSATDSAEGVVELATIAETDTGTAAGLAVTPDGLQGSIRNLRFVDVRLVASDTDVATDTTIQGDWVAPFACTLIQSDTNKNFFMAWNDSAGTTGTMVVDVHLNGTTIMDTNKLDIESTEKSTADATTQPDLSTIDVAAGDIFTFDIDTIHTTPAKGLVVRLALLLD